MMRMAVPSAMFRLLPKSVQRCRSYTYWRSSKSEPYPRRGLSSLAKEGSLDTVAAIVRVVGFVGVAEFGLCFWTPGSQLPESAIVQSLVGFTHVGVPVQVRPQRCLETGFFNELERAASLLGSGLAIVALQE